MLHKFRPPPPRLLPGFPALPGLVLAEDPLRYPGHVGDLPVSAEAAVQLGRLR